MRGTAWLVSDHHDRQRRTGVVATGTATGTAQWMALQVWIRLRLG